jgi:hypothetical protein
MTAGSLAATLQACATGIPAVEADTGLLTASGAFLHRSYFTSRFIRHETSVSDGTAMAVIDRFVRGTW